MSNYHSRASRRFIPSIAQLRIPGPSVLIWIITFLSALSFGTSGDCWSIAPVDSVVGGLDYRLVVHRPDDLGPVLHGEGVLILPLHLDLPAVHEVVQDSR